MQRENRCAASTFHSWNSSVFFCVQLPSSANERHSPFFIYFAELFLRLPLKLYLRLRGYEKLLHNVRQMPWMQRRNWNRRLFCETTKTERCIEHCVDFISFHLQMSKWFGLLLLRSQANSEFHPFSIFGHHLCAQHSARFIGRLNSKWIKSKLVAFVILRRSIRVLPFGNGKWSKNKVVNNLHFVVFWKERNSIEKFCFARFGE